MSSRSLRVSSKFKNKVVHARKCQGFANQKALAHDLGISRTTISNFETNKFIDYLNFVEICEKLGLNWQEVADKPEENEDSFGKLNDNAFKPSYMGLRTAIPDYDDFHGRNKELEEIEDKLQKSRVVAICGNPGIGKTYLAAELAQRLSNDYKVCWIDRDELTLDELFLEINDFLQENQEQGFVTTYSKEKENGLIIPIESKISALIQIIQGNQNRKFIFFIKSVSKNIKDFIEKFRIRTGSSRLVLIERYLHESLGVMLSNKLEKFIVKEYSHDDALSRIRNELCFNNRFKCSPEEIKKICEKTENHPFAIDLVIGLIKEGKIHISTNISLEEIIVYDKNNEAGLCKKIFSDIKRYLNEEEAAALCSLAVFRTLIASSARESLNISQSVWNSLLKRGLLKSVGSNNFRVPYIIATAWAISQPKEKRLSFHQKAADYYWIQGQDSFQKFKQLDQKAYIESYYHWQVIEKSSQKDFQKQEAMIKAVMVLNDLIHHIHEVERIPSERLPGVTQWLFELDENLLSNNPWVLLEKGRKLEKKGDYEEAKQTFTQAAQIFSRQQKSQLGYSIALYYVGKIFYLMQQYQDALRILGDVWKIAKDRVDSSMEIRTLGKIISCNMELGQEIEAENAAIAAERIAYETEDGLGLALILYRQGSIKRHQGYFSDAENLFGKSAKNFHELGDIYRESKSLVRLGICQKFQGKYESARTNLIKAISLKESIKDLHGIARDKDYLADIYRSMGNYKKAEELYLQSLKIKKGSDKIECDNYGIIKAYNNLARISLLTHKKDNCKDWVSKSETLIKKQSKYLAGLDGSRLMIQGDLYSIQGDYESALQSYKQAAQCFQTPNPIVPHSYARNLLNLGQTYLSLGKFEYSLNYLNQAYQLFEDYEMVEYQSLSLTYLSRTTSLISSVDQAELFNQKARKIALDGNFKNLLIVCLESQGIIESIKILKNLNSLSCVKHVSCTNEKRIQKLLNQVDCNYEEALDLCQPNNNTYYCLKLKKYFWHFSIKYYLGTPIPQDKINGLLKSESIPKYIIETELIKTKYLLTNLKEISDELAEKIAEIALNIVSKIAISFGFNDLKEKLEFYAFKYLCREEYEEISTWLSTNYPQRKKIIEELTEDLEFELEEVGLENIKIYPREKSIYSIYKKKQSRKVRLNNIFDIIGFRLITKTKEDCYEALAVVQNLGSYFKGEGVLQEPIRDYIEAPKKSTGYQSIHINIYYEYQDTQYLIEFQIRTEGMHLAAEYGIEAFGLGNVSHLHYKYQNYEKPSSKKNYELREKAKSEIKLIIKCSSKIFNCLEKIFNESKLELFSLDEIDQNPDNLVLLKIGVISKDQCMNSNLLVSRLQKVIEKDANLSQEIVEIYSPKKEEYNFQEKTLCLSLEKKAILIKELSSLSSESISSIYAVTPKGDIIRLPQNSCCIDFAYAIHSDLGDYCARAKVNDKIEKLETKLNNGDMVEIITQKNNSPSKDWLNWVKTSKAKHRIKRWLKNLKWSENIAKGRELLRESFNQHKIEFSLDSQEMVLIADKLNYQNLDSLLVGLSYGDKTIDELISKIKEYYPEKIQKKSPQPQKPKKEKFQPIQQNQLIIQGSSSIEYRLAKCCNPQLGQPIIGIIPQRNRWISIHTKQCNNPQKVPISRQIKVWWYSVKIVLKTHDEIGVLGQLGLIAEKAKINLQEGNFITYLDNTATFDISIQFNNNAQLENFKSEIEKMEKYISMECKSPIEVEGV